MLPVYRNQEYLFSVPKFELTEDDAESFMDALKAFHSQFHDCFHRSETQENVFQYMAGQFSSLERKSIEPIALRMKDGNVRSMQRSISSTTWDEGKILARYHAMVADEMGEENGVLIFDESGFPKKGDDSAGVSRQYCGRLGKVDNCAEVFWVESSHAHWHAGPFLPLAPENQAGEKKHLPLRCHRLESSWRSRCP